MRIVSWNCNGALRNKLRKLEALNADLCIIQECENPLQCASEDYKSWAKNHLWVGTNKNRGLGVFAKPNIHLEAVPLDTSTLELFLPCKINSSISLLAVWTRNANSPTFQYIGQLWKFLQKHEQFLASGDAALIGDLNSNACWDVWDRWWNHSDVVQQLEGVGLTSLYHHTHKEQQGSESIPTFYMYRKREKPYHIDYVFLSETLLKSATCDVGDPTVWLELSDHMPLIINIT
ncbi:MAG: endonuclease/exonuclease/phosphatase family protein [Chlorobaculum sp.]|jgi:exonuclease III|nr:endonuclease/exonuclease/phosphatase family protein [Chlorobaculum sp.]